MTRLAISFQMFAILFSECCVRAITSIYFYRFSIIIRVLKLHLLHSFRVFWTLVCVAIVSFSFACLSIPIRGSRAVLHIFFSKAFSLFLSWYWCSSNCHSWFDWCPTLLRLYTYIYIYICSSLTVHFSICFRMDFCAGATASLSFDSFSIPIRVSKIRCLFYTKHYPILF